MPLSRRGFVTASTAATLVPAVPATATRSERTVLAYVGSRTTAERQGHGRGITVYRVDRRTPSWTRIQLLETENPTFLAMDRAQRYLYAVHGDLTTASAYAIAPGTGELRPLGTQQTGGENPAHIAIDPGNRYAVITNHSSGSVVTMPLLPDGSLGPVAGRFEPSGTPGPHRDEQTGPKPHQTVFDPTGSFLAVPDKGLDEISVLRLDAATGALQPESSVATREMAGPRHLAFHPALPSAYTIDELRSTVTTYRWDGGRLEALQVLPSTDPGSTKDTRGGEIVVEPSGQFAYATNRGGAGDDSPGGPEPDTIGIYRIDRTSGMLDPIGWQSSRGIRPRFACTGPTPHDFHATNERSDIIVGFRIGADGRLHPHGEPVTTGSPVCLVFAG